MKLIEVKDVTGSSLWVNPDHLVCVMTPGPLAPGNGMCIVMTTGGGTMNNVSRESAQRLIEAVNAVQ